jgi:hypothetical protein
LEAEWCWKKFFNLFPKQDQIPSTLLPLFDFSHLYASILEDPLFHTRTKFQPTSWLGSICPLREQSSNDDCITEEGGITICGSFQNVNSFFERAGYPLADIPGEIAAGFIASEGKVSNDETNNVTNLQDAVTTPRHAGEGDCNHRRQRQHLTASFALNELSKKINKARTNWTLEDEPPLLRVRSSVPHTSISTPELRYCCCKASVRVRAATA